jgi:signal transduction histidine kinase
MRGLRFRIAFGLILLVALAFLPLLGGLSAVTQSAMRSSHVEASKSLGRAIAAHVAAERARGKTDALPLTMESHIGTHGASAIVVFGAGRSGDPDGAREPGKLVAGDTRELEMMPEPTKPYGESSVTRIGAHGPVLDVAVPDGDYVAIARIPLTDSTDRSPQITQLFALYTALFAVALVVFTYFFLTRLIVRPIEALAHAADRVATGASTLEVPEHGAEEVLELGASLRTMTTRLLTKEEALRKKVDELERTTKNLSDTRTQLAGSERLASVGRLAAGVAHEIGNPITAMMGMQELLIDGGLPEETERDFLKRMRGETERVHTIVRDLLDFARSKDSGESQRDVMGSPASARTLGSVHDAVDAALALARHARSEPPSARDASEPPPSDKRRSGKRVGTHVEMSVDVPAQLPPVRMSTQRMTQVLLNLLLNARHAASAATGDAPPQVHLRARQVEGSAGTVVELEVEDNGPGIAPDVALKIFDPFFTTKDVGEGTGLGLSVCRGLVESAGGEIALDPTFHGGARFRVRLPVIESASA